MKPYFLVFGILAFFQSCLKCPDDYIDPQVAPRKPLLTAAAVHTNDATITWSFAVADEDHFKIERKTDNTGFIIIDSTGIDARSYSDSLLAPLTRYTYRIAVFKNNNPASDYSNEVTLVTNN